MSRAQRLLSLLELLRQHRSPVRGEELAARLDISLRTLYRDMGALQQQGAHIDGEAGVGYRLRPGHTLPPLMFSKHEVEALALGLRWVALRSADPELAQAARGASAKVRAVLPAAARFELDHMPLLVPPAEAEPLHAARLPVLRAAIGAQQVLRLHYRDGQGSSSQREVWPFALGFFEATRVLSAWCLLRQGFRHFRLDRIEQLELLEQRYPRSRQALLAAWRQQEGLPPLNDY